jgi:RinA family phage transcriptional activator
MKDQQKVPRHVYKFIEAELYDYKINKKTLEALKNDVYLATFSGDGTGRSSRRGSPSEAKVMQLMSDRLIQRLEYSVKAIEDVLETLTEEENKLVRLKYFDKAYTNKGLAMVLGMSEPTVIEMKKKAIRNFAIRYSLH